MIGAAVTEAEPPDWPAVVRLAAELFTRTKDLRIALRLARGAADHRRHPGFRDGLEVVPGAGGALGRGAPAA
ncbi:MAG: type VI secretion system ImpA family N-terminal domain-containing protein [Rhodospirillales bacterium]